MIFRARTIAINKAVTLARVASNEKIFIVCIGGINGIDG
jgi:hypothetical protein